MLPKLPVSTINKHTEEAVINYIDKRVGKLKIEDSVLELTYSKGGANYLIHIINKCVLTADQEYLAMHIGINNKNVDIINAVLNNTVVRDHYINYSKHWQVIIDKICRVRDAHFHKLINDCFKDNGIGALTSTLALDLCVKHNNAPGVVYWYGVGGDVYDVDPRSWYESEAYLNKQIINCLRNGTDFSKIYIWLPDRFANIYYAAVEGNGVDVLPMMEHSKVEHVKAINTAVASGSTEALSYLLSGHNNEARDYVDLVLRAIITEKFETAKLLIKTGVTNHLVKLKAEHLEVMEYLFKSDMSKFSINITDVYLAIISGSMGRAKALVEQFNTIKLDGVNGYGE